MSKEELQEILKEREKTLFKFIVYPVISATLLMFIGGAFTYFGKIRVNEKNIDHIVSAKVDQLKFNEYLTTQNRINTLNEERIKILTKRVDNIENEQKRLNEIDIEIARLQEKIKRLLDQYTIRTRDGGEVQLGLECFIKDVS